MELEFHPEATAEFKAQILYYEDRQRGLGADFADEVFLALDRLDFFPDSGAPVEGNIRSVLTKRFPFIVYYEVVGNVIFVWAILHGARKPGFWKMRTR